RPYQSALVLVDEGALSCRLDGGRDPAVPPREGRALLLGHAAVDAGAAAGGPGALVAQREDQALDPGGALAAVGLRLRLAGAVGGVGEEELRVGAEAALGPLVHSISCAWVAARRARSAIWMSLRPAAESLEESSSARCLTCS